MLWHERGDISSLRSVSPSKIISLDVETTGLNPRIDEVLQLAIARGDGPVMLNEFFGADRHCCWRNSQHIHGITPEVVEGRPSLMTRSQEITDLLRSCALLIGYNLRFDCAFLRSAGVELPNAMRFDVIREAAPYIGRKHESGSFHSWVSLEKCAQFFGYMHRAHNALDDARITLACYWHVIDLMGDTSKAK